MPSRIWDTILCGNMDAGKLEIVFLCCGDDKIPARTGHNIYITSFVCLFVVVVVNQTVCLRFTLLNNSSLGTCHGKKQSTLCSDCFSDCFHDGRLLGKYLLATKPFWISNCLRLSPHNDLEGKTVVLFMFEIDNRFRFQTSSS